jgi:DOPA 4,5-dioxygenase
MRPTEDIKDFHVHVYFDPDTRDEAATVRAAIEAGSDVQMGRWHDKPVGPHPKSMYQVAFEHAEYATLVPWLMLNHGTLDVLIHPNTGDDVPDHRDFALWLGNKLPLNIQFLEEFMARQAAENK